MRIETLGALTALFVNYASFAGDEAAIPGDGVPLFASDHVLKVEFGSARNAFSRARKGDEPIASDVTLSEHPGKTFHVGVTVRGRFRLKNCDFPPIWLDFDKDELEDTVLAGQNRLKLATPCKRGKRFEELLLKEYLAYKLLNVISPKTYRVRLARVAFLGDRPADTKRHAFFIEHARTLGPRIGLERLTVEKVRPSQLDSRDAARLEVFAYLIGHTDWSMSQGPAEEDCCHNVHLFLREGARIERNTVIPVMYDFDMTGLVNPPYAEVSPGLRIRNVRQRLYRGYCRPPDLLGEVIAEFVAKRQQLEAVTRGFTALDEKQRDGAVAYLAGFFETVGTPRSLQREVLGKCRGKTLT